MRKFEVCYRRNGKNESVILLAENIASAIFKAASDSRIIFLQINAVIELK